MASKDMGGMRGSGSNARGTGNYGRGGAKPSSGGAKPSNKAAKNMSAKAVVKKEMNAGWDFRNKPVGRIQIAEARRIQKAEKNYKPTAAQKNSNASVASAYRGSEREYRRMQLKVGPRSVKQTTAPVKKNPASSRKVVTKPFQLYLPPRSRKS